jgi:hypothetical protein
MTRPGDKVGPEGVVALKKRKAEIYSGGYICVNCGNFMDEGDRCGEECGCKINRHLEDFFN